jgi:hypothetical protein
LKTTNYHHLDISGHDGMDEQDVAWRNGYSADEGFGCWANVADFCSICPNPILGLSMINMDC